MPDGTTAQVQGVAQMDPGQGVHTLAEVASQHSSIEVGHSADLQENGHIIITGDDGQGMVPKWAKIAEICEKKSKSFDFLFSAYPLSGMITVPVSAGTYQAVVASMQQGGGLTFHTADAGTLAGNNQTIQLIGAPLQIANGQIIAKVETETERQQQSSIQNLVTKVMQSGTGSATANHINEVSTKPATLTITPVASSNTTTTSSSSSGSIQFNSARLRSQGRDHEPDTTESLD